MKTDIEIAQSTEMLPIEQVAKKAGIDENLLEYYGKVKAKIDIRPLRETPRKAKLILVTATNPTPAGEGIRPPPRRSGRCHGKAEQKYHALSA